MWKVKSSVDVCPKNTRHPMVETSEVFFIMGLLQWNVKSPGVL